MSSELRHLPRVAFVSPARVEVPVRSSDPGLGMRAVQVRFYSISWDGAGVTIDDGGDRIVPGTRAVLSFTADGRDFEIPAWIVWAASSRVGIRFHLAQATPEMRAQYTAWIVGLTNHELAKSRATA